MESRGECDMDEQQRSIKYVGFYDLREYQTENRYISLAATNKMDYICKALAEAGYHVQIVSPSWSNAHTGRYYPGRTTVIDDKKSVTLGPTFGARNKLWRLCSYILSLTWITLWLLRHIKRGENMLVYHSPGLCIPVLLVKRIKRCRIVLEVEEVYAQVWKSKALPTWLEYQVIINANSYVFPTRLLQDKLKNDKLIGNVRCCFLHGDYQVLPRVERKLPNIIKIVYAGSIEKTRNGAFRAIECCKYLSDKYRMHIIGFGEPAAIEEMNSAIDAMTTDLGFKICSFHGTKVGHEYDDFLFSCDIALNPQNNDDNRMEYAFPSKVISYLAHDLHVVSTRLKCITTSKVADLIDFPLECTAQGFAETIMKITFDQPFDASSRITALHSAFVQDIKGLLA